METTNREISDGQRIDSKTTTAGITFTIPLAFPSVNSLHQIIYNERRVELKPEVRKFRNDAMEFIPRVEVEGLVHVDIVFHYPHYYRNGNFRRRDTHNGVKVILDLIAQKGGWDDSRIKSGSWASVDSTDEKVVVTMCEL